MCDRGTPVGVICCAVLALTSLTVWGRVPFETQVKTVTVVDANGVPVPDARVYRGECLVWDRGAQTVRLKDGAPWQRTDADGAISFEFVRQGSGRPYLITDDALERMGCLFIARKDPNESYTVQLEKPARIKGVIRSSEVPFSDVRVRLDYRTGRSLHPLLLADYNFDTPVHEVSLGLLCPAGCDLNLCVKPEGPALRKYQNDREIAPLKPGQVLDVGSIELRPISGFKGVGKPATELHVAEWVKGEPVTLAELKGKVVLLDFWGLWCSPCRKAMPKLAELHEKYARDGLVIIALHDASLSKAALLDEKQQSLDLSDIPFRVAIDTLPPQESGQTELRGKGKTIEAYGVTSFPTLLLIDKDGGVQTGRANEEQLYLLLYGRSMPKPTFVGRMIAAHRGLFVKVGVATGLILLLGIVLGALRLRQARIGVR